MWSFPSMVGQAIGSVGEVSGALWPGPGAGQRGRRSVGTGGIKITIYEATDENARRSYALRRCAGFPILDKQVQSSTSPGAGR
jgi:hypothetical protein